MEPCEKNLESAQFQRLQRRWQLRNPLTSSAAELSIKRLSRPWAVMLMWTGAWGPCCFLGGALSLSPSLASVPVTATRGNVPARGHRQPETHRGGLGRCSSPGAVRGQGPSPPPRLPRADLHPSASLRQRGSQSCRGPRDPGPGARSPPWARLGCVSGLEQCEPDTTCSVKMGPSPLLKHVGDAFWLRRALPACLLRPPRSPRRPELSARACGVRELGLDGPCTLCSSPRLPVCLRCSCGWRRRRPCMAVSGTHRQPPAPCSRSPRRPPQSRAI